MRADHNGAQRQDRQRHGPIGYHLNGKLIRGHSLRPGGVTMTLTVIPEAGPGGIFTVTCVTVIVPLSCQVLQERPHDR